MQLSLRAGDRLYVNGGVLRFDRKVNIELLNDVTFLLEAHVLQAEKADTPLKQLYFVIQTLLIDPASSASVRPLFQDMHCSLMTSFSNDVVLDGLKLVHSQIIAGRYFDALKIIRSLYPVEANIISAGVPQPAKEDAAA